jgi:hypothetical protein
LPAKSDTTAKSIQAGLLTWILPGLGHYLLGHRALGVVLFIAITVPYALGLAIGGVVNSVNPRTNKWLFLAELGVGGYTVPGYMVTQNIERNLLKDLKLSGVPLRTGHARNPAYEEWTAARSKYVSYYPASDVAQIYLATAGLLNLLAILDAISRAQNAGLPTFYRELPSAAREEATP